MAECRVTSRDAEAQQEQFAQGAVGPGDALRLHVLLLLEHLQRRRQFRFRLGICAAVGQQPTQFLVPNRLPELVLDLPAQRDVAAQVGLGSPQRADVQSAPWRPSSPSRWRGCCLSPSFSQMAFCLLKQRHGAAGLAAEAVGVRQCVQRPGLGAFVFQARRAVFAVGEERAQQVNAATGRRRVGSRWLCRGGRGRASHASSNCPARTVW